MSVAFIDDETLKMTRKIKRKIKRNLEHAHHGPHQYLDKPKSGSKGTEMLSGQSTPDTRFNQSNAAILTRTRSDDELDQVTNDQSYLLNRMKAAVNDVTKDAANGELRGTGRWKPIAEMIGATTKDGTMSLKPACKACDVIHVALADRSKIMVHRVSHRVFCQATTPASESQYVSADFTIDLLENPMILACTNDDYPLISLFDAWGFGIRDMEHSLDELRLDGGSIKSFSRYYRYKALCSPSHINLKDDDNVLRCFKLSERLLTLADLEPEFNQAYNDLARHVRMYSVQLLDNCRDAVEVGRMLSRIDGLEEVVEANSRVAITFCPRLHLAIHKGQKEFVVHPHCQKETSARWNGGLRPYEWMGFGQIFLHFFLHLIMLPFTSLYLVFKVDFCGKSKEGKKGKQREKEKKKRRRSNMDAWKTRSSGETAFPAEIESGRCTMGQNSQESGRKYWATRSSVRSLARTGHSFACSGLLASLAPSAALTRSLAPLTRGTVIDYHILRNKRPPASPSFLRRIKKSFGF